MKLVLVQPSLPTGVATMMTAIEACLRGLKLTAHDIVLLPEHTHQRASRQAYLDDICGLAAELGANVVGGSHHQRESDAAVNTGAVVSPDGVVISEYDKLRPYAAERRVVEPGGRLGEMVVAGRRILVTICADFWFTDLFTRAEHLPDLVLVPAYSVTRKPTPDYSRSLWRHLAIARAYELGVYVGISDWSHSPEAPKPTTSGVGGFADPTTTDPDGFFTPIAEGVLAVDLSFDALETFRADRIARGFFWKKPR